VTNVLDLSVVFHHELELSFQIISIVSFGGSPHFFVCGSEGHDIFFTHFFIRHNFLVSNAILFGFFGLIDELHNISKDFRKLWLFGSDLRNKVFGGGEELLDISHATSEVVRLVAISLGGHNISFELFEVTKDANNVLARSIFDELESIGNNGFEVSSTTSLDSFFTKVTILLGFGNITHDSLNILEKFSKVWFT